MKLIKINSRGQMVKSIQYFLLGLGYKLQADGIFGINTEYQVERYQLKNSLVVDGIIGNGTLCQMLRDGLSLLPEASDFPPKPNFRPLVSKYDREQLFGKLEYYNSPSPNNPEGITLVGNWVSENISIVDVPQLKKATNGEYSRISFHKKAVDQLLGLWEAWEDAGLLELVKSYEGSFYPRYVRGSRRTLSNHSWGTAFDINYWWNKLGRVPASKGSTGSVRELVPLANEYGFYWGGHFSRKDGMHFEIAKICS